jgi:hypothetical protein
METLVVLVVVDLLDIHQVEEVVLVASVVQDLHLQLR